MSRVFFGLLLSIIGLLYLWLAYQAVIPGLSSGDWVAYIGAVLFLAAGVGAALAGVNLVRAKRR
ncbi:MAG TPA: hypothetical protein VM409_00470 [Chloroflexia bacterium]|nr:hypothetical protein [Chloroflexia bacterium]